MNTVQELLGALRKADIYLSLEGENLKVRSQAGPLPADLRAELKKWKPEVVAFLKQAEAAKATQRETLPRVDRTQHLPLSFSQERLAFLDQLQGPSDTYNIFSALRLEGSLDLTALNQALSQILTRHESLRTRIQFGEPNTQLIAEEDAVTLQVQPEVIKGDTPEARTAALHDELNDEAGEPFILNIGPLIRARLFRETDTSHVLTLNMHHIVSDGWSMGVLVREVAALYEAAHQKIASPLPDLPVQYADYAHWQRAHLEGERLDRQKDYWRQHLAGAPPLLDLPWDRPRPAVQTYAGEDLPFSLPGDLMDQLNALAKRQDASIFMVLLAGFKVLLHRLSGQDDINVGSPIANRTIREIEGLIGLFMNTIVLRTPLHGAPTFRELINRVRDVTLAAYAHQDLPFDRIVEAVQPERSLSHEPLFQVMFMLQNAPSSELELSDLRITPLKAEHSVSKFDLTLSLTPGEHEYTGAFEFNTDLFDRETIQAWGEHLRVLLQAVAANPDQRIDDLPLLSDAQRNQLLIDWNATAETLPDAPAITHLFRAQVTRTPDAAALSDMGGRPLTYAEVDRRANRVANHLLANGVGAGDHVGLCMNRSADMVIALLGILKSGAAYVPLDPNYPAQRLAYILEDAGVRMLISGADVNIETDSNLDVWTFNLDRAVDEADPNLPLTGEETAYMIYTSGSTGKPKGVIVTHVNAVNFFQGMDGAVGVDTEPQPVWLAVTSISFDISVLEMFWTLTRGYHVVVQREAPRHVLPGNLKAQARELDFSLLYFASDTSDMPDKYRLLLEGAKFADANGFEGIWTPERHFHAFGGQFANPSVAAAAVATITKNIRIHSGSVVAPLHHPVRIAEEWSMVDNLSKGRVAISFASGWHPNDFIFAPDAFKDRHARLYEAIEKVRHLWRGGSMSFTNGVGKEIDITVHPKPIQEELPVWVTSGGNVDTFKSAGRIGANLLTHMLGQDLDDLKAKIQAYRDARAEAGHDPDTGVVTLMLHTYVGRDLEEVKRTVAKPFKDYLRSSLNLMRPLAEQMGLDMEKDEEVLVETAFSRYFGTHAMLGTPDTCMELIRTLKELGVDQVACLIDFGVETERALQALEPLRELRDRAREETAQARQAMSRDGDLAAYQTPAESIKAHGVTHMQCTPSYARMVLDESEGPGAISGLGKLLVGGEALPADLAKALHEAGVGALYNMYGPTETTIWSSVAAIAADSDVTIGEPITNTQIYILDDRGRPAPAGVAGDLIIAGDGVTRGYHRRADLSADRFLPDPFAKTAGARMYVTGDKARRNRDGALIFLGRQDDQVKLSGFRIEPGEIRTIIGRHELVGECMVAPAKGAGGQTELVAFVKPTAPVRGDLILPKQRLRENLPDEDNRYVLPNGVPIYHNDSRQIGELHDEIFRDEIYLRHGLEFHGDDIILDVGANIGSFSIFARHQTLNPTIYSFEPIPPTNEMLRANMKLHGVQGDVFSLGLSDREETAQFTYYPHMSGLSGRFADPEQDARMAYSLVNQERDALEGALDDDEIKEALAQSYTSKTFDCKLTTVSHIIREKKLDRIDYLKVDVEKSELLVLRGIEDEHWPMIRQIGLEVDGRENLEAIRVLLTEKGFSLAVDDLVIVEGDDDNPELLAYMVYAKRPDVESVAHLDRDQLASWTRDQLPDYMVPSRFIFLEDMPRTPNGKIDKRALPTEQLSARRARAAYTPPTNESQVKIAEVWQEVLDVEQVGLHDNFFELGGNSLLLTRVLTRLQEAFGRKVPMVSLFRHPTVDTLAAYLDSDASVEEAKTSEQGAVSKARSRAAERRRRLKSRAGKE